MMPRGRRSLLIVTARARHKGCKLQISITFRSPVFRLLLPSHISLDRFLRGLSNDIWFVTKSGYTGEQNVIEVWSLRPLGRARTVYINVDTK